MQHRFHSVSSLVLGTHFTNHFPMEIETANVSPFRELVFRYTKKRPISIDLAMAAIFLGISITGLILEFDHVCSPDLRVWLLVQVVFLFIRTVLKVYNAAFVENLAPSMLGKKCSILFLKLQLDSFLP